MNKFDKAYTDLDRIQNEMDALEMYFEYASRHDDNFDAQLKSEYESRLDELDTKRTNILRWIAECSSIAL